jgi:hypothetical protein
VRAVCSVLHTGCVVPVRAGSVSHAAIPRVPSTTGARRQYDWKACAIALVAGFAVAVQIGLVVTRIVGSAMFLVVVVTLVSTAVSRWTYARVAKRGSRPIEDETCPL